MSGKIERLCNEFTKWQETLQSKALKVNFAKTKMTVSTGITQDGMSKGKVDPCVVSSMRVKTNSVLCVQCGRWVYRNEEKVKVKRRLNI